MQHRKLSHNLIFSSIAPTSQVSLLGAAWRCLHRDAWDQKHVVFFAGNSLFCQNTIFSLGAQKARTGRGFESSASHDFWIVDTGSASSPVGRVALQVFKGNFRQGLLLLDMGIECSFFSEELIAQLITLCFLNSELASLKVAPLSRTTTKFLSFLDPSLATTLTTFTRSHIPTTQMQEVYKLDSQAWFDSPQGQDALVRLNWLKKRKDRERAVQSASTKPKRKPSLLFSLLTLGRRHRI